MTDEEILSAAARLRAAKRRIVAKTCAVCGTPFEGIVTRRYCSDRCRVQASRERGDEQTSPARQPAEERRATIERLFARQDEVASERERRLIEAGMERRDGEELTDYLTRLSTWAFRGKVLETDSTEILRQSREERSEHLARLSGLYDDDPSIDA